MCWSEKCCFFINIDTGGFVLGLVSFIISGCMTAASIFYLTVDRDDLTQGNPALHLHAVLDPYLSHVTTDILLWVGVFIGIMSLTSSVLLMIGIKKAKPGFVLCYFVFGIFFTIAGMLGGLLLLLQKYWVATMVMFIGSIINIHFLLVVHTVYDSMLKGKVLSFSPHERLVEER